jgi:hypothetical protein
MCSLTIRLIQWQFWLRVWSARNSSTFHRKILQPFSELFIIHLLRYFADVALQFMVCGAFYCSNIWAACHVRDAAFRRTEPVAKKKYYHYLLTRFLTRKIDGPGPYWLVKVKVTLVQALRLCTGCTTHRGSRGIALLYRHWGSVQAVRPIGEVEV